MPKKSRPYGDLSKKSLRNLVEVLLLMVVHSGARNSRRRSPGRRCLELETGQDGRHQLVVAWETVRVVPDEAEDVSERLTVFDLVLRAPKKTKRAQQRRSRNPAKETSR